MNVTVEVDADGFPTGPLICDGEVQCPVCGEWVETWADPEEWEEDEDGTKRITGYGPGTAEHCGYALINDWDGAKGFKLREASGG